MSHTMGARFFRTVTCDRCNKTEESHVDAPADHNANLNRYANDFQSVVSPGATTVRIASVRTGWTGNWHLDMPQPQTKCLSFDGDLCQECADKLTEIVTAFLADGIKGTMQMAVEQENAEPEIPF